MPANLTEEAKAKWLQASQTRDPKEKLRLLQEFHSSIPKHKGNEKLRMQIKRKISTLKMEIEEKKNKKSKIHSFKIEKTSAAIISLLGFPNSGKSTLIQFLTRANPIISNIPFTTQEPIIGSLQYEDIQFQLVELPSIPLTFKVNSSKQILHLCDGILLIIDTKEDVDQQLQQMLQLLEENGISIQQRNFDIDITRCEGGGLRIISQAEYEDCTLDDIKKLLTQYRYRNAIVKLSGKIGIKDFEESLLGEVSGYKPALLLFNKQENITKASSQFSKLCNETPCINISFKSKKIMETIGRALFEVLGIIRVYTKEPGERFHSEKPFIFKKQVTVSNLAKHIHSRFLHNFKYAKVWGVSAKYPGEKVGLDHILADKDIIELRIK